MVSVKRLALAALAAGNSAAMEPIVSKGQHFFFKNGTEFHVKGIAYQQDRGFSEAAKKRATSNGPSYIDPLSDEKLCKRDVPVLAAAGTNVIRTYSIDPTANHDACMKLLADAGIYVFSDLSSPDEAIIRSDPQWNTALYKRYTAVVDALAKYDNTIGFFAGNEVSNNKSNTDASAFVKAAVRDTKAYIKQTQNRWLGVGYAANDDATIRNDMAEYFNCGDSDESIDFFGYNIYEWCGDSTFTSSGYSEVVQFFSNYSVPVFFAEYGCNTVAGGAGRTFQETTALYSDDMTDVISGGIVYMYFEEENDYGLVKVIDDTKVEENKAYDALKSRIAAVTPKTLDMNTYSPANKPAACPAVGAAWAAAPELPPTPDNDLCDCMFKSISCAPSSGLAEQDFGEVFSFICGADPEACAGVNGNATTGVFGAYSMCNATQKLGYVLDTYYKNQKSASTACDFDGKAVVQSPSGSDDDCKSKLASASAANAAAATGGTSSSSKPSNNNSSSSLATPAHARSYFSIGDLAVGLWAVMAMGAGAAVFAL